MHRFLTATRLASLAAGFAALAFASAHVANAQDAAAAKADGAPVIPIIIVIDPERILRESSAGKSVAIEAEKYGRGFEDDNRKDESAVQAAVQELQKTSSTLTAEQLDQKRGALERKAAEIRQLELKRRQAFDKSYSGAMRQVQQAMNDATKEVALTHKADAVLLRQALLFYNAAMDATPEVIEKMNKQATKIDFLPPKVEADDAAGGAAAAQPADPAKPAAKPKATKDKPLNLQLSPQPAQ